MSFPIHQCPLCNAIMRLKVSFGVMTYYCPQEKKSHYEVESDSQMMVQHIYVFPYAVDNFNTSLSSRLYKWSNNRWQFIRESYRLVAAPSDLLLKQIEKLCDDSLL